MKISRMFFKSKYLNKKQSVSPVFIIIVLFSSILVVALQIPVLLNPRAQPESGMFARSLLTAVIMLIITTLTVRKLIKKGAAPPENTLPHHRPQFIEDLQNENKFFSKVLSHDLRSPLSSIVLLASYLKTKNENSENNRYIELIEQSARKELDMMAILLCLMRSDSFKPDNLQEVSLKSVIDELIAGHESQISQKRLHSSVSIPQELTIHTEPDSFSLVLKTLIFYALHYSDPGESLEIRSVESQAHTEIVLAFSSSALKIKHPEDLFRSENLLENGIKAFPENVDLYFCRKLISSYNGTVHVQATEKTPAIRFILTLERKGSEHTAI